MHTCEHERDSSCVRVAPLPTGKEEPPAQTVRFTWDDSWRGTREGKSARKCAIFEEEEEKDRHYSKIRSSSLLQQTIRRKSYFNFYSENTSTLW